MKTKSSFLYTAAAVSLLTAVACGDDTAKVDGGGNKIDAAKIDTGIIPDSPAPGSAFHQVEQLARPGVAEALLITNDFLNGFNALAPGFVGIDPATLAAVVGEAKTVLKALYLGTCFIDNAAGLTDANEMKPAGQSCFNAVGSGGPVGSDGQVTAAAGSAAAAYATLVFGQFIPDVMRIDTGNQSSYLSLCGGSGGGPLLCGGRTLTDDTIDVTLNYLLAGAAVPFNAGTSTGLDGLKQHLVSDGVGYSTTVKTLSVLAVDPANSQQGHPTPSNTFPFVAAPF